MRAVNKLERRFKRAFAHLQVDIADDENAEENANLSKQIKILEADISRKDIKIETLGREMAALTQQGKDKEARIADLEVSLKIATNQAAELEVTVEQAKTAKAVAAGQLDALQDKLKAAQADGQNAAGGAKDLVALETDNAALQAELKALRTQRQIDLTEINVILEKLTPLVEGN